jgi:hypothetical protein
MKHYAVVLKCKCGKEFTILEVGVSPDGDISFHLVCVTCGEERHAVTKMCELVAYAKVMDKQELLMVAGNETVH